MSVQPIQNLIDEISRACKAGRIIRLMEVCGTHTVSLFRSGVKSLLPDSLRLISGPGCPVCVTSQAYIDIACRLAARKDVVICTYGDMVRVPGKDDSLEKQRACGANILVIYSARDAVSYARAHPDIKVVFLAVGFETTAPATAAALIEADRKNLDNFYVLTGHKLVIPALKTLLTEGEVPIDGFMCPGHVSVVIGAEAYTPIVRDFGKPCVIIGFEAENMLRGILQLVRQVSQNSARVENAYGVAVKEEGNPIALDMINRVFHPGAAVWRGMGTISESGLDLNPPYERFDALTHFALEMPPDEEPAGCRCGEVIQGKVEPPQCSLFGRSCTPRHPIGPCMVSSEGTCAAWYKYQR